LLGSLLAASCLRVSAQQTTATPPGDSSFTFTSKVNVVLVPVQVRDAQGRAVGNLKKANFQVFDRGKLQVISRFTVEQRAPLESTSIATASPRRQFPSHRPA
jgi:hypothetical protein